MEFYIEIVVDHKPFRLQTDKTTWRKVLAGEELQEKDFVTSDIYQVIGVQNKHTKIEFTDSGLITVPGRSENHLIYYDVFVKREVFPSLPSREQLISTIRHGDKKTTASLILNISGFFELRMREIVTKEVSDPSIIVRFETLGTDDVGDEPADDANSIEHYYEAAMAYWVLHLQTGKTEFYTNMEEGYPDLFTSHCKLREVENSFEEQFADEDEY